MWRQLFAGLVMVVGMSKMVYAAHNKTTTTTTVVNVGVVLDLSSSFGKVALSCINMSLSDFDASHPHRNTTIVLHVKDSKGDIIEAAAQALDLIKKEEVQAIIGPTSSMQASFMIDVGDKAQVPIISFSATRPSLTSHRSPFFFRITQDDTFQVKAIGAIVKAFKWRQVVPIYVDNEFGDGIIPYLFGALQEIKVDVPYQINISPTATNEQINHELNRLMTMPTRVFVVHMTSELASRIFTEARKIGMMDEGYVWIVTDAVTNEFESIEPATLKSMQGVLGVRTYVPGVKRLESFKRGWLKRFLRYYPGIEEVHELNVFGLWAYDAAWALAIAVEKAGTDNLEYIKANDTTKKMNSSNYLFNLGINKNGLRLRDSLSNVTFKGLAGEFSLDNGQLQSSVFEIVNVIDNDKRNVGFWSLKTGLTIKLQGSSGLRTIIWPGDLERAAKGWQIPRNGKKLRVVVPKKVGFREFVNVFHDPETNVTEVSGYCIDVFKAVIEALPYAITYEFIPYDKSNADPGGSYNDLVQQLFIGKFDAVVGDITIRENRSQFIDYTLPFTESGVSMVVPMKTSKKPDKLAFVRPFSRELWAVIVSSIIFVAFIVWLLEHRINEQFKGHAVMVQILTSISYSLPTGDNTRNYLTKVFLIVWLFVVFFITQSYTASLASILTVQELQPTVTDINQLLINGDNIGYQGGSFVYEILKSLNFDDSKLKMYRSAEQMHELFIKGSMNGGISAAVDENPYIKLFLAKYCFQYTTSEPTYKAGGFGFGFPLGSPLVPNISRAILKVTESNRIREIENKWFQKVKECSRSEAENLSSTQMRLGNFMVLFGVILGVSMFVVGIHIVTFPPKEPTQTSQQPSPPAQQQPPPAQQLLQLAQQLLQLAQHLPPPPQQPLQPAQHPPPPAQQPLQPAQHLPPPAQQSPLPTQHLPPPAQQPLQPAQHLPPPAEQPPQPAQPNAHPR